MTVTEILQLADQLVFAKRGKHLDDLQESIIKGVWEDHTYQEIADECNRSESRVRNVAAQLWKLLSEDLGENIEKDNFRSVFKRLHISSSQNQNICHNGNHNFHYSPQILYNSKPDNQENITNNKSKSPHYDLTLAPQIINFYARESELKTISNWLFNQNTRLISVLGLSGIGKTTLVKRFIDLNLEQFEVIIWRSLKYTQSLDLLINEFLNICQQKLKETIQANIKKFFDLLTEKRCLIIIDDVHNIFVSGDWAGQYKPEYKDYQNFFKMITETNHQSNIILISQEQCVEMHCLDEELYPIKCLELSGLDDVEILNSMGLKDEGSWLSLINLYEGNPYYLKTIVNSIKNIFDGHVAEFLAENELIITKDIQTNLQSLFDKLSPTEQQIVLKLSNFEQPVFREELKTSLELSSTDFINGLESLQQRYLVTKIKEDKIMFKLSPVFREYVKNCSKNSC